MTSLDNEKRIQAYIDEHYKNGAKESLEPVSLRGVRVDLPVYRIPTKLILYNIKNGRFAAEYRTLVEKAGRTLDPANEDDARKIQNLLLEQNKKQTEILMDDIKRIGQKYPGIMTCDGYLVNGNRRMAVLNKLQESGEDKYDYLLVARLPKDVTQADLWKIEAGIQLSRQERLDYGPINTLLKLKEGTDAGLTASQIAPRPQLS